MRNTVGMVSLCSSNSKLSSHIDQILGLPAMRDLLRKMSDTSSGQRIEILVEYGSVIGGTGDNRRVVPSDVVDGRLRFEGGDPETIAWQGAFNGKFVDPTTITFLVKIWPSGYPKSDAFCIVHEVAAHISNAFLGFAKGYWEEHNWFGYDTNPFYSYLRGGSMVPPSKGSFAEKLLPEFQKCNFRK